MSNLISNQGSVKHLQICIHNEIPLFTIRMAQVKKNDNTWCSPEGRGTKLSDPASGHKGQHKHLGKMAGPTKAEYVQSAP